MKKNVGKKIIDKFFLKLHKLKEKMILFSFVTIASFLFYEIH